MSEKYTCCKRCTWLESRAVLALVIMVKAVVFLAFHMNSERSAETNKLLLTNNDHATLIAQASQAAPSQADHIRVRGWMV